MKEISPTKPNDTTYPSHPYIYLYVIDQHLAHKLKYFLAFIVIFVMKLWLMQPVWFGLGTFVF